MLESLLTWDINVPASLNKKVTSRYWTDEWPAGINNYLVPIHLMHVFELWWCGFHVFVTIKGWSSIWVVPRDGADVPWEHVFPTISSRDLPYFSSHARKFQLWCIAALCQETVSNHTYFLLLVLLLWPGWPGIAQLCQVFPPSVAWGAWACREANENAEPERREDLPARCQGMSVKFVFVFLTQTVWVLSPVSAHIWGGVYKWQDMEGVFAVPLIFYGHASTAQWHLS